MGFETKILNVVKEITEGAYFFNGTLCIEDICEDTAKVVLTNLETVVTCKIEMTRLEDTVGHEYLFDFV